jgi:hypothetical protein
MIKRPIFSIILYLFAISAYAAIPSGYYSSTEGKKAAAMKTALHTIICQDTTHYLDYGSGKGSTWEGFYYTDRNPVTNAVIDMYSDSVRYFPNPNPNFTAFGQIIHIEHSVPKSWWGCDINHPDCPAKDLNHLYPADGITNTSKNDNPLGVATGTPTLNNGVSKVGPGVYDGYVGTVFEPADQYNGDFARSYFYMATAYEHYAAKWDTTKPENMMQNNTYPVLKPWAVQLLLQWHRQDPVSEKERTRVEIVYGIQQNRNPFIDHPEMIEYIWGNRTTIPYRLDASVDFPYLNFPNDNDTLSIGKVYYLQAKDTVINLHAMNLTGDLTLTLSGTNTANFTLDKTSITKAEAELGTAIGLHFNAQSIGNQSAKITITGGGIAPIVINLKAFSSDEFTALPAKNTTNTSFQANWTASAGATGYTLNVYTLQNSGTTSPKTLLEEDFILLMPNTWTKEGYTDNTLYSNIRLASGSTYGKITLPQLDLSTPNTTLTVRAKQYSNDTGAKLTSTLDNNSLAVWTTAVSNQDFTVTIPQGSTTSSIALSAVAGKRVYVDYVKVVAQIPVFIPISISGFPKLVGNLISYTVNSLLSANNYYYTVTPEGNGAPTSNHILVQTNLGTEEGIHLMDNITWVKAPSGILLKNILSEVKINLLDFAGKKIRSFQSSSSEVLIPFPQKGIYLLQIQQNSIFRTLKINH